MLVALFTVGLFIFLICFDFWNSYALSFPLSCIGSSPTPSVSSGRLWLWAAAETADTGASDCDDRYHGTKLLLDCRWLKYERGFLCEKIIIQKRQSGLLCPDWKSSSPRMMLLICFKYGTTKIYFLLIKSLPVLLGLAFILLFEASLALCKRNYHSGLSFLLLINWFIFFLHQLQYLHSYVNRKRLNIQQATIKIT